MVTLETLMNLRIQLHMFVYPKHVDNFLEDINSVIINNGGYLEYNAPTRQVIIKVQNSSNIDEIKHFINDKFAEFLSSEVVENDLKANITEQAFNDYKLAIMIRENYIFLYNATILTISNIDETIIIQL